MFTGYLSRTKLFVTFVDTTFHFLLSFLILFFNLAIRKCLIANMVLRYTMALITYLVLHGLLSGIFFYKNLAFELTFLVSFRKCWTPGYNLWKSFSCLLKEDWLHYLGHYTTCILFIEFNKKCIRCQHSNHELNYKYIISILGNIYTTFCPKTRIAIRNFLTQIIRLRRNGHKKDKKKRIWYTPPHTFLCSYTCDWNLWKGVYFLFVLHNRNQFISLIYLMEGKTCSKIDITNLNSNKNKHFLIMLHVHMVWCTPYISQLFAFHGC